MFMWNVSSMTPRPGEPTASTTSMACAVVFTMSVSKRFSGSSPKTLPALAASGATSASPSTVRAARAAICSAVQGEGRAAGEDQRLAIERAADDGRAERLGGLDAIFQIVAPAGPRRRLLARDRALEVHARGQNEAQPLALADAPHLGRVEPVFGLGHEKLDEIEAQGPGLLQEMQRLRGEGPDELHRDDADRIFHVSSFLGRRGPLRPRRVWDQPFTAP